MLTASVGLPVLMAVMVNDWTALSRSGTWYTAEASAIAGVGALVGYRRVTDFPGTRNISYVLPSFSIAFGFAAAMLLLFRLNYSGLLFITGFVGSVMCGFLIAWARQRGIISHFYLVPFGNNAPLDHLLNHRWIVLREPRIPADGKATIVADLRAEHPPEWERMLAQAAIAGWPVLHAKQLSESLTGKVEIEHLSENSFGSLSPNYAYRKLKRVIDFAVALVTLPVLVIPFAVIAVVVRASSPGPAFFRQDRIGYRGKPFRVVKFRTMTQDAGDPRDEGERGDLREHAMTRSDDRRITPVGRFLRRSRLDELPQLVNVLKGEMSLIGPRPEAAPLSSWYEANLPFYLYRHIARPGITGWAQVNQGHVVELDDVLVKLHYDFFYIKNFSAWLDMLIALRTVTTMLTGFGAR